MESQRQIVPWPMAGRSDRFAIQTQPPFTTPAGTRNVWPDASGRERGGSRPALVRRFPSQIGHPLTLGQVTYATSTALITQIVAISNSGLFIGGDDDLTFAVSASVNPSEILSTAEIDQKLYIGDFSTNQGESAASYRPKVWDPATGNLTNLIATDGTLPVGCPCICNFRSRLALAGGTTTPYGIFFSAQGDPEDWDFSSTAVGGAVNLGNAFAGIVGETVTAFWPHADNCLIIGCPTSLWMLRGDPRTGQLACISQTHGIVDKHAFCTTPDGQFVFLSADGLYAIPAGCGQPIPQSISREKLPHELLNIDRRAISAGTVISMAYDIFHRGIHIFASRRSTTVDDIGDVHWWLDWETKSLWEVQFGTAVGGRFNPWNALARKNYPTDKSGVLIACQDSYVRYFDDDFQIDDEEEDSAKRYTSSCVFGPFGDAALASDTILKEIEVLLASVSASVSVEVFRGDTAEEALEAVQSGVPGFHVKINGGRSRRMYPRVRGATLYLRLSANRRWAFEAASAVLAKAGRVRA